MTAPRSNAPGCRRIARSARAVPYMIRGVVIRRPAAGEAAPLVSDLLQGDDPVRAEAAKARLLVLGPRAVPHLLGAVTSAPEGALPRLLGVIELLPPTRQAVPVLDAAAAHGERAHAAAASVWASWLAAEDRELATLGFDRLATLLLDEAAPSAARQVAVDAIRGLRDHASSELLARLPAAARPVHAATATSATAATPGAVDDEPGAPLAAEPVPDSPAGVRQHVASAGAVMPLSQLHRALERARAHQRDARDPVQAREWLATRGAVHLALAQRGSTVALYDLRELLEQLDEPPPVSALAALRQVGDASCLEPLAAAWTRVDDGWTREQLQATAREICERHGIGVGHAVVKRLRAKRHPLAEALPAPRRKAR